MKLSALTISAPILAVGLGAGGPAIAGGLFLPGAGAISTSRAGAGTVSADDGEALVLNPAGIAKAQPGTVITLSAAMIDYAMQFQRNGDYPAISEESTTYAGQPYALAKNDASPPLGFGSIQPVPVIAIISDLGRKVKGLHVGAGLYAPNAYPFRDMATCPSGQACYHYQFNVNFDQAPLPSRYDIVNQQAAVLLPSVVAAYSILPNLDVGGRFSLGFANLKSTTTIWGLPANYEEYIKADGQFSVDASDNGIPTFGFGVNYRPTPELEFGANFAYEVDIHAKGTANPANGPAVALNGQPITIGPPDDANARCAPGGVAPDKLKACVGLALPTNAQVGGRYKFLDKEGKLRGDIELDLDWENWGKQCDPSDRNCVSPGSYQVTVDAVINNAIPLNDSIVEHGLRDTYAARLGGSYIIPMDQNSLTIRGGLSYDTAAAKQGWERADLDGAARTTIAAGAGYRTHRVEVDAGFGVILEGTRTDSRTCAPTQANMGCAGTGIDNPPSQRQGPDPINPLLVPNAQAEDPVNEGTYKSHYILFMLGATTWF
jgi:long-subunit fatty acid transport protein